VEKGDVPEIVAVTVLKAASAAVPNRRYPAGKMARWVRMLRSFVPESAFDKSLRKQAGLRSMFTANWSYIEMLRWSSDFVEFTP
jgi:hypothetical protein